MKKLSVILSIFLLVAMTGNVYGASIFETGIWRETGQLSNGISYGIRAMTEEEKVAFESGDISQIKAAFEPKETREIDIFKTGDWRETGKLSNGMSYGIRAMTEEEKAAFESNDETEISLFSYSWSGNVNVPISNSSGTNGKQLGSAFIISPDSYAAIGVGSLPSTMPTVNISAAFTNGMDSDWVPNVRANEVVVIDPGSYSNYEMVVKVSTYESKSASAKFSISTY
ncbi:hypothetical protein EDD65_1094 [Keratinibaculum paraultunense]|uniref:Uncharacterized protein n=1 Tax=Keratinibaculum paraultunense TaxID=1278232 RepID=A0A4R3KS73_9FIRM|nr:hypothetical protein [Keratinibaculum paraultunense]QQY79539.1 hypothetical protein JL105_10170 [Keratinibaculum paraultunense]TCS87964.1 hypothetical protein EDD65_1094 [Keratinibaculum paraultunense]